MLKMAPDAVIARGREVLSIEADGLVKLAAFLDEHFAAACQLILECSRQLVVTGIGKSGLIARKVAATFAATGTPAAFIHPSEAGHGDLGMLATGDVLLVLSNSGNTSELLPVLTHAKRLGISVIGAASRADSTVINEADVPLLMPQVDEACAASIAPTSSTTMQLALGDALAMAVMDLRGINKTSLRALHPAGAIGISLTPVRELMHGINRLPLVPTLAGMPEVISIMTQGCFGIAGVVDHSELLIGIITDGDLRRKISMLDAAFAEEVMTRKPKTISPEMLAADALAFLNRNQITAAFVVADPQSGPQPPLGIIHIHDLLRHGLN